MLRQSGFTLIELIMVIVLIGIMAVSVAPKFNSGSFKAVEIAGEVLEAVRYTQTLAMNHSGLADSDSDGNRDYYGIYFASNGYTVAIMDSDNIATPIAAVPALSGNSANYVQSWASGITLTSTVSPVFFSSRGEPLTSAGTALSSNPVITVTVSGNSDTITIQQVTGFAYR